MRALLISLPVVALMPLPLEGCGICSLAIVDWVLPPAALWLWLPLAWLISTSAVASRFGVRLRPLPPLAASIALSAVAFLLASSVMGPLITIPLCFLPLAAFIHLLIRPPIQPAVRRAFVFVSLLFVALTAAGIVHGVIVRSRRTKAEYICQWASTGMGRAAFQSLAAQGAASLPAYRYILANSTYEHLLADTAEVVAALGQRADIALLERALTVVPTASPSSETIRKALSHLTKRTGGA